MSLELKKGVSILCNSPPEIVAYICISGIIIIFVPSTCTCFASLVRCLSHARCRATRLDEQAVSRPQTGSLQVKEPRDSITEHGRFVSRTFLAMDILRVPRPRVSIVIGERSHVEAGRACNILHLYSGYYLSVWPGN
jgi:hypothetical protein